jgi:serine/threonine protein kinase
MFPYSRSSAVTHLQMSHSFIVRLHFAFQSDDEYFFVLDFMAGGDFFAFLKRHRKLDENQTRFYAAEVLLALEYMHCYEPPIAYRDLKPENIMIGIDGHIKLTDFGFAKFFGEEIDPFGAAGSPRRERSHSIVGSAFYIAPEIVNSSKTEGHDLAVDFWSFGCLIYEMVCGHALFADPKSEAMFSQMKKSGQISKGATFQQFTMYYQISVLLACFLACPLSHAQTLPGTDCSTPKNPPYSLRRSASLFYPCSTIFFSATLICGVRAGRTSNSTSSSR